MVRSKHSTPTMPSPAAQARARERGDSALCQGSKQCRRPDPVRHLDEDEVVRRGGDVGHQGALRERPPAGCRLPRPVPQMHCFGAVEHQDVAMVRTGARAHHGHGIDDARRYLVRLARREVVGGLRHNGLEGDRPAQDEGPRPHQQAHPHHKGHQGQGRRVEREAEAVRAGLPLVLAGCGEPPGGLDAPPRSTRPAGSG